MQGRQRGGLGLQHSGRPRHGRRGGFSRRGPLRVQGGQRLGNFELLTIQLHVLILNGISEQHNTHTYTHAHENTPGQTRPPGDARTHLTHVQLSRHSRQDAKTGTTAAQTQKTREHTSSAFFSRVVSWKPCAHQDLDQTRRIMIKNPSTQLTKAEQQAA